ncbi:MAG: aromatic amino acid lyase, partial [Burkholderiaceae bacterium]|nr:aromatic amino acid lyase [Burkholderiaceae bacterium]
ASIDSLPTSGGQEDHVSQSCWAAQKLCKIIDNLEKIFVVEMWGATRAIQLAANGKRAGKGADAVFRFVAQHLPKSFDDQFLRESFDTAMRLVANDDPIRVAEQAVGEIKV